MADRKPLTLRERAIVGVDRVPYQNAHQHGEACFIAGWHARGRADRVTKAERAVVEAAKPLLDRVQGHKCKACGGVEDHFNDCPALAMQTALSNLERAKGRK